MTEHYPTLAELAEHGDRSPDNESLRGTLEALEAARSVNDGDVPLSIRKCIELTESIVAVRDWVAALRAQVSRLEQENERLTAETVSNSAYYELRKEWADLRTRLKASEDARERAERGYGMEIERVAKQQARIAELERERDEGIARQAAVACKYLARADSLAGKLERLLRFAVVDSTALGWRQCRLCLTQWRPPDGERHTSACPIPTLTDAERT